MRIAVVGDLRPDARMRAATDEACGHAASALSERAEITWIATPTLAGNAAEPLADCDGVWIAPGSPYQSLDGALEAIRFARASGLPLIGTCGGFQHVIIEYARNVLGVSDAHHAEYDPDAPTLFITPLACTLVGATMSVQLLPGTIARAAYGITSATERYSCNFGLNNERLPALRAAGLIVSGIDDDGEVRIVELRDHPFFLATLFVPQLRSTATQPHPLVTAFVAACAQRAQGH